MVTESSSELFQYTVDKNNHIVAVNQSFIQFAEQNAWAIELDAVMDKPLLSFIDGQETQIFTELLLARVREKQQLVTIPFRCDSQNCRRYLSMSISPMADGMLSFSNQLHKQELRSPLALAKEATHSINPQHKVCMCSWCNKFKINGQQWLEVEAAIDKLDLFAASYKEKYISHGICPDCQSLMMAGRSQA